MNNELPKVHKKTSFYICLFIGIVMLLTGIYNMFFVAYEYAWTPMLWGAILLLGAFFLKQRNDREKAAYEQAVEERKAEIRSMEVELEKKKAEVAEIKEKIRLEQEAAQARRKEWDRTHGRILTKIAGVTFENEDGSSRQRILRDAFREESCGSVVLETYKFKGSDAIAVYYEDKRIGNIPKDRIKEVIAVMDRISAGKLTVDRFRPDDDDESEARGLGGFIYRADLLIVYNKFAEETN